MYSHTQPKTKRHDDSREQLEWCAILVLIAILLCCGCQAMKPLSQTSDPFSRYHNGSPTVIPELSTGAAIPAMTPGTNQPRFVPEPTNGPFRSMPNSDGTVTDNSIRNSTGGVTLGSGYGTDTGGSVAPLGNGNGNVGNVNVMNTSPAMPVDVEMTFDTVQNATAGQSAEQLHGSTATSGGTSATTSTYIGTP